MDELIKNIEKLRSNETQMDEKQKKQYAKALAKLRAKISKDALKFAVEFTCGGLIFGNDAENDPGDIDAALAEMERIMMENRGVILEAEKSVFMTYGIEEMVTRLLPLQNEIKHKAYGPYWLAHCSPISGKEYTYTNDLIGMEWWDPVNVWAATRIEGGKRVTDYRGGVRIMLPPTKELLEKEYEEEKKRLLA